MGKTKSVVKYGEIYVKDCHHENYGLVSSNAKLFPLTESPYLWPGCDDAYYYTWTEDPTARITWLTRENKEKLARSAGFCPHRRCQLDDLHSSVCLSHSNKSFLFPPLDLQMTFLTSHEPFLFSILRVRANALLGYVTPSSRKVVHRLEPAALSTGHLTLEI